MQTVQFRLIGGPDGDSTIGSPRAEGLYRITNRGAVGARFQVKRIEPHATGRWTRKDVYQVTGTQQHDGEVVVSARFIGVEARE